MFLKILPFYITKRVIPKTCTFHKTISLLIFPPPVIGKTVVNK